VPDIQDVVDSAGKVSSLATDKMKRSYIINYFTEVPKLAKLTDFEICDRKFGLSQSLKENDWNGLNNEDSGMMWTHYVNINSGRNLRKEGI
jgi:hypothetical protein